MRIQHNIAAMNAYRNYNNNTKQLNGNLEKLSSGYKINRSGDDAAGLAISEKMRAQITGLKAATKNTKDAVSLVKTAEGALQEVQDMLNRMVYLGEEAANGIYDNKVDRQALQDEVVSLATEIERIGNTANFNGQKLLNGELADVVFQIGPSSATDDQLNMGTALGDLSGFDIVVNVAQEIASGGTAVFDLTEDGNATANAMDLIKKVKGDDSIAGGDPDALINKVSSFRGKMGAVQNRLEHTLNNLSVMTENIQDAESTVRDTDVAEEMMSYTKNNILIQSAQAMLAQANAVPQGVLQLLQ